ncbi:hypothetical protein SERLA73DRAFT_192004 [Serpula lacrymans var. lacrymans S7.3]|uniref:Uncharacterized protein n=2 Tax=Serpula lacrymans var. lacrymans TaxID=341189 RepID=F8QIS2_SERL3|nr:uncharacterized protein SERLADRAFT_479102 [Serpula lacrymans var. lacrymans S7.9]EGN91794.1 hypothetical protein SERLA73DRAFT_192004 [Serpula lacrymans var. lacrymans S7.3]EGO19548.1 hypothetical protein SERLADRAFT_479102 [Serpula lacrymans var. lacrymans S7.9]
MTFKGLEPVEQSMTVGAKFCNVIQSVDNNERLQKSFDSRHECLVNLFQSWTVASSPREFITTSNIFEK